MRVSRSKGRTRSIEFKDSLKSYDVSCHMTKDVNVGRQFAVCVSNCGKSQGMKPKHLIEYSGTAAIPLLTDDIVRIAGSHYRSQKARTFFIAAILKVLKDCKRTHTLIFYREMIDWMAKGCR